jgi:hypothetical protein
MPIATIDFYSILCEKLGEPHNQKGEVWLDCPECGIDGKDHCSFGVKGWHCFVCGEGGSLAGLARNLSVTLQQPFRMERKERKKRARRWQEWQYEPERFLQGFERDNPVTHWQAYPPEGRPFTLQTVKRWRLGYGVLPSCACHHKRLVYPAIRMDGRIVAFRGRALGCDCEKWIQSAGSRVILWNAEDVIKCRTVIVCESPVDGMLAKQYMPDVGVVASTGGAGTWRDAWTELFTKHAHDLVIVWFDNDLSGQAAGETKRLLAAEWMKKHPKAKNLPRANGPHVANKLAKAGVPVYLHEWMRRDLPKMDLSDWLMREYNGKHPN